jgi:histidinol phosphatase-like enzyme
MKAFDRIREGLEQAIAHTAGEPVEAVLHCPHVPDVKGVRQKPSMI